MKKLQQTILLFLAITISTRTHAQLGGLLKKAKDKVTEKATEKKVASTPTIVTGSTSTTTSGGNYPIDRTKEYENRIFTFPDATYQNKYQQITYNVNQIKEKFGALESLSHVRKEGEKGNFHFAKDYPELKHLIKDEQPINATIQFSSTLFKNGKGDGKTSFRSSGDHIYALLTANSGTIKDALQIKSDEEVRISVAYLIYNDELNEVGYEGGVGNVPLTSEMAKEKYVVLDILPTKENASVYRFGSGDYSSLTSDFAYLHTQENFNKSGSYKIKMCIRATITDDWGKPKQNGKIECNGFFDYNFAIKDAKDRVEEGKALDIYMKTKINDAPVAIPEMWKDKSSPLVMGVTQDKLVQMLKNTYTSRLSSYKLIKFYAKYSGGGWTIQKNDLGIPLYRYSSQWYTTFWKKNDGTDCFYQGFGLRQNYAGGGTYGEVFIDTEPYKNLKCEEMK